METLPPHELSATTPEAEHQKLLSTISGLSRQIHDEPHEHELVTAQTRVEVEGGESYHGDLPYELAPDQSSNSSPPVIHWFKSRVDGGKNQILGTKGTKSKKLFNAWQDRVFAKHPNQKFVIN